MIEWWSLAIKNKQVRYRIVDFQGGMKEHDQGSLHLLLEPGWRTCLGRDSNPGRLHRGERYSKELSRNLSNNFLENLHEAFTWLPSNTCTAPECRPNSTTCFLHGKTFPSRRGHHYEGTWPGPSSTGALGAGMHRSSGFKLPQASILAKSYLESLVISNNYLQHLLEAYTATFNDLLKICSTVLLGRRFSRRHSLILYC
jgi:hypothetical protein